MNKATEQSALGQQVTQLITPTKAFTEREKEQAAAIVVALETLDAQTGNLFASMVHAIAVASCSFEGMEAANPGLTKFNAYRSNKSVIKAAAACNIPLLGEDKKPMSKGALVKATKEKKPPVTGTPRHTAGKDGTGTEGTEPAVVTLTKADIVKAALHALQDSAELRAQYYSMIAAVHEQCKADATKLAQAAKIAKAAEAAKLAEEKQAAEAAKLAEAAEAAKALSTPKGRKAAKAAKARQAAEAEQAFRKLASVPDMPEELETHEVTPAEVAEMAQLIASV